MSPRCLRFALLLALALSALPGTAQDHDPTELMRRDVGIWDVELRMFTAPDADPIVSQGTETNTMVGDRWLIGLFEGTIMDAPFEGARRTGLDPAGRQIVSSWVDSTSPHVTDLAGEWSEDRSRLTLTGTNRTAMGEEAETRMVVEYHPDGSRTSTMVAVIGGAEQKLFEFHYTRATD